MPTLLLVDDVPANLGVLLDCLGEAGYAVRVAESGARALELMERVRPDLVLLDVMMPDLDGFETCRRIKTDPAGRDVPVIFVTALDEPVDKVKGFAAGAVDYVGKPFFPDEVLARVRAHLGLRDLRRALEERNAELEEAVQRRAALEAQLQQSLDRAVLMVARDGSVPFRTRRAEQMLARYFPGAPDDPLPAVLRAWLDRDESAPFEIEGPPGRLCARRFSEAGGSEFFLLVLEETAASAPLIQSLMQLGLTAREAEVLYWIALGKTNPEIAVILDSAANTVKKHAQNILDKLRVETRTSAARLAMETMEPR